MSHQSATVIRLGRPIPIGDLVPTDEDKLRALFEPTPEHRAQMREAAARQRAGEQAARERAIIEAAARETREREIRVARLRAAGIPAKHIRVLCGLPDDDERVVTYDPDRRLVDPETGAHVIGPAQVVASWRRSKHHTLVLGGSLGAGKSLAACWLVEQGPRQRYPHPEGYDANEWPHELRPRYIHAARLARLSLYGRAGTASELDEIERCALLVIDEIGGADVGKESSWVARLDALVAVRADCELDTVMTTNLTVGEFKALYGERVLDRMRGDGSCWQGFNGKSLRASAKWGGAR